MTAKMTIPTAKFPPIKNTPNASMTLPAESVPLWPSRRTIRVEATFRESRSRVVRSKTVGKATKSLKLLMLMAEIRTMIETAILKVKSKSSKTGGKGTNIITKMSKTKTGIAPCPVGLGNFEVSNPKIFIDELHPTQFPKVKSKLLFKSH
jgi:hypothetical protein